jgi:glutamate-1-semialdehyde aminotransferase
MEQKELNERYEQYKQKIEARIAAGEADLKVQDKKKWIRVVEIEDTENPGKTKRVQLPGISGETSNERGARVAEKRMNKLIVANEGLYALKSTSYQLTEAQINKMVEKIEADAKALTEMLTAKISAPVEQAPVKQKFSF